MRASETINLLTLNVISDQMVIEDVFLVTLVQELELQKSDIMTIHLETLGSLLELEIKEEAIKNGKLSIIMGLFMQDRWDICSLAEACLTFLTAHEKGMK
jgi:hypothetical protein